MTNITHPNSLLLKLTPSPRFTDEEPFPVSENLAFADLFNWCPLDRRLSTSWDSKLSNTLTTSGFVHRCWPESTNKLYLRSGFVTPCARGINCLLPQGMGRIDIAPSFQGAADSDRYHGRLRVDYGTVLTKYGGILLLSTIRELA